MRNKKIVMLVTNEFLNDPRVYRSAKAAVNSGYAVTVVCFNLVKDDFEQHEDIDIYRIKLGKYTSKVGKALKNIVSSKHAKQDAPVVSTTVASNKRNNWIQFISDIIRIFMLVKNNILLVAKSYNLKADLYHANDLDTLLAGFVLSTLTNGKLLYDSHELYTEMSGVKSLFLKKCLSVLENILIKRANKVITVNDSIAKILQQRYSIKLPIVVMNCPPYTYIPNSSTESQEFIRIIYQGMYIKGRGLEELILSAKYIKNGVLFLRGLGSIESKLRRIVTENNLGKKVRFLEPVQTKDLLNSLNGFDIGIIPYKPVSLNNKFCSPNKIFEYLMTGLALAASDLPELRKIICENNAGMVFDPSDPKSIAESINGMISNRKKLHKMKINSLNCAKKRYNWENQSEKLLEAYRYLLKE
jgi:glycosyltransferase involved in cell wall biosynthesis